MEYTFAIICLLSLPLYLGFRHSVEYYEGPFSKENFGVSSLLALILFCSYFVIFINLGIEELYELKELGRQSRKFATFFIYPSIGFGLAIFPKMASEYIFDAFSMASLRFQFQLCAFIGWLLIAYLASILVL